MNIELGKRAVACRAWRWLAGCISTENWVCVADHNYGENPRVYQAVFALVPELHPQPEQFPLRWIPDPSRPATRGCLLELVRQAYGNPAIYAYQIGTEGWCVSTPRPYFGPTESEALIAALEAAPEKPCKPT